MASYGAAKKQVGAKFSKAVVGFEHPAKGTNHCADCVHFAGRDAETCKIVSGHVEATDWCRKYKEKIT